MTVPVEREEGWTVRIRKNDVKEGNKQSCATARNIIQTFCFLLLKNKNIKHEAKGSNDPMLKMTIQASKNLIGEADSNSRV